MWSERVIQIDVRTYVAPFVPVGVSCLELPSITVERFKESLCADLEAASKLTEGLSDAEMKVFLDTLVSSSSEGQILTSGVGECIQRALS